MSSYFARIDENNIVTEVIAATQEFIDSGAVGPKQQWIQCCINHMIRGRYPGKGYTYDRHKEEFFPPKPPEFPSFVWNNVNGPGGKWIAPKPFPGNAINNQTFDWDESIQDWVEIDPASVILKEEPVIVTLNMGTTYVAAPTNANPPIQT